jgi:hypothetical protein
MHRHERGGSERRGGLRGNSTVRPEWRLDSAQNFPAQRLASAGVGGGLEEELPRNFLHFLNGPPKFTLI